MRRVRLPSLAGHIAVVGNAPETSPCGAVVDNADHVVRFNNPFGYGGSTGTALHELYLVNCGGQMREWLDDGTLVNAPHIHAANWITFPIHPDVAGLYAAEQKRPAPVDPDRINYADEATDVLDRSGRTVRTLPLTTYQTACAAIGLKTFAKGNPVPSTGYLALFDILLRTDPASHIDVFGFGFAGWEGHDWAAEKIWVSTMAQRGRIIVHPV